MKRLRTQISLGFAVIVLLMIALVSFLSNICINNQFEKYVEERQSDFAAELANGLSSQYDAQTGQWNLDYIHGFGMVALSDGYIIQVYDRNEQIIWDAQNHDMTLCHDTMQNITRRMEEKRPDLNGKFVTYRYELKGDGEVVGYVDICYYTPYYLNETDFQFLEALNRILIFAGILSLAAAAAGGFLLAGRISKPISSTIDMIKEISEGNYGIRLEQAVRTGELYELKESVNQMAEALSRQESLRKRLTTDVAHELRTPLTNVLAYLEAMMEGVFEPTQERMQLLYDELKRISVLVGDLEQLQQVENENLKMSAEPVDLRELAYLVRNSFEQEMSQKRLTCSVEGASVTVYGDKNKLQQVLVNLLSNAVKYSHPGGKINIRICRVGQEAQISVTDQGIGIPKEELPLVFERFYRTDISRSRKTGGVGIGLTIVKSIVQAHGGTVEALSEEGKGSCFRVSLPLRPHTAARAAKEDTHKI